MIAVDQYGTKLYLKGEHPRKELLEALGVKSAQKMYVDKSNGTTKHIGYIASGSWWTFYVRWECEA